MTILVLPQREDAMTLWGRYVALVKAQTDRPELVTNLQHQIDVVRAHRRFSDALMREDDGA